MNQPEKNRFTMFFRRYFQSRLGYLILLLLIIVFGVVAGNLSPLIYGSILDFISTGNLQGVRTYIFIYFGISLLALILGLVEGYLGTLISHFISSDVKKTLYRKILRMRFRSLDRYDIGELMSRLESDAGGVVNFYIEVATSMVLILFNLVVSIYFIFKISYTLSFVAILFIPASMLVNVMFRKKLRLLERKERAYGDKYFSFINSTFSNIKGIRAFQVEGMMEERFEGFIKERTQLLKFGKGLDNRISLLNQLIQTSLYLSMIYLSAKFIINGVLTIGSMVAFNAYIDKLFSSISRLLSLNMNFQGISVSMERIELLEEEFDEVPLYQGREDHPSFESIRVDNVSFAYQEANVLDQISLTCKKPGLYAIVGKNGCGKSTLAKLLMGFYETQGGKISFGDVNLHDIGLQALRKNITYVQKEGFFLKDTLINNIKIADQNASDEQVIALCKALNLHEFISSLPEGYHTVLEENAGNLSSGQKQKISIARAFLRNSQVVVLDEITSDLDGKSEKEIVKMIKDLSEKKIVLFISHRINSILSSDQIFVLDEGRILAQGTHDELIEGNEIYRELFFYQESAVAASPS